ncbi:MAG: hypothetical protein GXO90_02145 [FCB group bacterium]|nr:hypothetical protein [FCB group bacterium]
MKTRNYYILLIAMAIMWAPTGAAVLRVNNISGTGATYTTLQAAHDAASAGDTLAIDASLTYGSLTVTKRLVIIGPGYFLGQNPETQANISPAGVDYILLNSGSEGTVITGLLIKSYITVNASNIIIKRNLIQSSYSSYLITIYGSVSNTIIKQNYIYSTYSYRKCVNISANSQANITNNYIGGSGTSSNYQAIQSTNTSVVTIENNVIDGGLDLNDASASIKNNILIDGTVSGLSGGYTNNIANDGQFGSADDNQTVADMTTVFLYSGSTDGQWQLKTGSPAIGAGVDGVDCGMFGGIAPYVLSGIPGPLPAIYYLKTSGEGTESAGLEIRLKAKVRN